MNPNQLSYLSSPVVNCSLYQWHFLPHPLCSRQRAQLVQRWELAGKGESSAWQLELSRRAREWNQVKGQHRASAGRHTALCWVWGWLYTSLHMFTPTELHVWSQTAVSAGDNLWNVKYMYLRFYIICLYIFEAVQVRVRKEFPDTEHLRREGVY